MKNTLKNSPTQTATNPKSGDLSTAQQTLPSNVKINRSPSIVKSPSSTDYHEDYHEETMATDYHEDLIAGEFDLDDFNDVSERTKVLE